MNLARSAPAQGLLSRVAGRWIGACKRDGAKISSTLPLRRHLGTVRDGATGGTRWREGRQERQGKGPETELRQAPAEGEDQAGQAAEEEDRIGAIPRACSTGSGQADLSRTAESPVSPGAPDRAERTDDGVVPFGLTRSGRASSGERNPHREGGPETAPRFPSLRGPTSAPARRSSGWRRPSSNSRRTRKGPRALSASRTLTADE